MSEVYISKEEYKRRKNINNSVVPAGKDQMVDFGIFGYEPFNNVVFNNKGQYICVYKIKADSVTSLNSFLSILCANLSQRFRISSFFQNSEKGFGFNLFLSLFYEVNSYFDASQEIEKHVKAFESFPGQVKAEQLELDKILLYWNMFLNSSLLSNVKFSSVMGQNGYRKYMQNPMIEVDESNPNIFKVSDSYFMSLNVYLNMKDLKSFPVSMFKNFDKVYLAQDVYKIDSEILDLYDKMLYLNYHVTLDDAIAEKYDYVNYSVILTLFHNDIDVLLKHVNDFIKICSERGYKMTYCMSDEEYCFQSLCSFGIKDFVNMHIMKLDDVIRFYEEV